MILIDQFNEQINNFGNGGKKAVEGPVKVGDDEKGSMTLVFGSTNEAFGAINQQYLVAINKGHPSICLNTESFHEYQVIGGNGPVTFYVVENGQWVEKVVSLGESITINPNTPFTYKAPNGGEALLAFEMRPKFEDYNDFGIEMDWSVNNAPSQEVINAVFKLPAWREKITKYVDPKKTENWSQVTSKIGGSEEEIKVVDTALSAIELIELDAMDKALELVDALEGKSSAKARDIVLFFSEQGPEFFEQSFNGEEMSQFDRQTLTNVRNLNDSLKNGQAEAFRP